MELSHVAEWLTSPRFTWCVFLALACLVWGPRLFRSFWVDEAGTFWMAHEGLMPAIEKTWHWPGQSILYSAIASIFCLNGGPLREFVLRLPSLLGMAVAAYFAYRLGEQAIGRGAGALTVVILVFHPTAVSMGTQARPYALAMGAVAASTWFLYFWVKERQIRHLLSYVAATTLVIYLHYLFGFILLAHIVYLLSAFIWERRFDRWLYNLAAFALITLLVIPLWPHLRLLFHEAHTLPWASKPTINEFTDFLLSPILTFGLFVAALLLQGIWPSALTAPKALQLPLLLLFLGLWSFGPLLLFSLSVSTSLHMFIPRYIAYSALAQAVLFAYLGWSVFEARAARAWLLIAILLSTGSPLSIVSSRSVGTEELAPFLHIIQRESSTAGSLPPVFFSSPLVESNFYDWRDGISKSYLFAEFVAYPIPNPIFSLPYRLTDEVKSYISNVIQTQLARDTTVIFVSHQQDWISWMSQQMKEAGFESSNEQPNSYTVVIYRRSKNRFTA